MARNKADQANIDGSDLSNYPNKRIRNNDGSGNGTPVNESVYGDIHEFHAKIMRDAKETYNGLPDNVSNGYQLYDAAMSLGGKNDLIKNILKSNDTTLTVPLKIDALKIEESVTFKADFASTNQMNLIQGSNGISKILTIVGSWSAGQFVRIINYNSFIHITGLYDSQIVPNLVQTITDIQASFINWSKIMSVFVGGGAMVFWNKAANLIPAGWQEVIDWRGRFPVGMDLTQTEFQILGSIGGEKKHTLTIAEMPAHNHKVPLFANGSASGNAIGHPDNYIDYNRTIDSHTVGSGLPHENLPPYRTVLFIEFIG